MQQDLIDCIEEKGKMMMTCNIITMRVDLDCCIIYTAVIPLFGPFLNNL